MTPNREDPAYTAPTVQFDDSTVKMGSRHVAEEICERCPDPYLILDSPQLVKLAEIMPKLYTTISGAYVSLILMRILNNESHQYWIETREARFGMSSPCTSSSAVRQRGKMQAHT